MSIAVSRSLHSFSGSLSAWIVILPKVNLRISLLIPLLELSCDNKRMAFAKEYGLMLAMTRHLRHGKLAVLMSTFFFTIAKQNS